MAALPVFAACAATSTVPAARGVSPAAFTVPRVAAHGNERVVYVFHSGGRGANPVGPLTSDGHGAYYATTYDGGADCGEFVCGTIVKLTPHRDGYAESMVYRFRNDGDGYFPNTGLIVQASGSVVGTSPCCYYGQKGSGVLFKLTPVKQHYRFTTLFVFSGPGPYPNGGLIAGDTGTFFGTALQGGSSPAHGAVFALTPSGSGYTETTIYSFLGGADGANPAVGLTAGTSGRLYGTTAFGGVIDSSCNQGSGCGTIFELTPNGSVYRESILYRFQGGSDGNQPFAALFRDARGNLFGTTEYGGGVSSCPDGCGTVFELRGSTANAGENVLYRFSGTGDYPTAPVIVDSAGNVYGVTTYDGGLNDGTTFELTPSPSGYAERDLHVFQGAPSDGETPNALLAVKGGFLGTTYFGGSGPCGNDLGCGVAVFLRQP